MLFGSAAFRVAGRRAMPRERRDDQRGHRLPRPAEGDARKVHHQTGIKVDWSYIQWDDLQTKSAAAAEADTYFADVTDVDWSKVGEYYVTKWFLPLNQYFKISSLHVPVPAAQLVCP